MQRVFHFIIEFFSWLSIFISPFLIGVLVGVFIYIANQSLLWLSIGIVIIAVVIGIVFAERIRKKYGCSRFMSRIIATPDIWPDEDKTAEKNK